VSAPDDDRISYLAGDPAQSLSADERAELDELRDLLRAPATWVEPDGALEDRIVAAIANEARTRPAAEAKSAERSRSRFGSLFRRPSFAFGSIATAIAAIVVVVVIATESTAPAPLHFAMVVSGTALAPGAHGSASLTKTGSGWRIELSADGLPHIQNGRYYQAWLKNAAGILVPVGTFNDSKHVTLWSGVPVTQFRTLTVTEQLANGNPTSSGKRVLIGRILPSG
jgi:hypothetical protein